MTETRPSWQFIAAELRDGGALTLEDSASIRTFKLSGMIDKPKPLPVPQDRITPYSQRDPRWANDIYAGGTTFATAGCYVTCVAMVASLAGYTDTPPDCAARLRAAGCFEGNLLTKPQNIPTAYPLLEYGGWHNWHKTQADAVLFFGELQKGPVIVEVDFRPSTQEFNQHFCVAVDYDEVANDVVIIDPWDGQQAYLLERYMLVWYALGKTTKKFESAICGMRILRVKE